MNQFTEINRLGVIEGLINSPFISANDFESFFFHDLPAKCTFPIFGLHKTE
ncbi:hypothetical protein A9E74_01381 [Methylophaga muralis]|uniref:Uncharacterized protein n=1 Tax=Methylophaga muralis TaxID=291169 RepID=A0A1E3GSI6_9GAMM|nr:hypothetical protein A9E74_01381 [Methylophaga muralis]